jgi:hypothetical protein
MWFAGWRSAKRERRYFCVGGKSQRVPALTTKGVVEGHVSPSRLFLEFNPFKWMVATWKTFSFVKARSDKPY